MAAWCNSTSPFHPHSATHLIIVAPKAAPGMAKLPLSPKAHADLAKIDGWGFQQFGITVADESLLFLRVMQHVVDARRVLRG